MQPRSLAVASRRPNRPHGPARGPFQRAMVELRLRLRRRCCSLLKPTSRAHTTSSRRRRSRTIQRGWWAWPSATCEQPQPSAATAAATQQADLPSLPPHPTHRYGYGGVRREPAVGVAWYTLAAQRRLPRAIVECEALKMAHGTPSPLFTFPSPLPPPISTTHHPPPSTPSTLPPPSTTHPHSPHLLTCLTPLTPQGPASSTRAARIRRSCSRQSDRANRKVPCLPPPLSTLYPLTTLHSHDSPLTPPPFAGMYRMAKGLYEQGTQNCDETRLRWAAQILASAVKTGATDKVPSTLPPPTLPPSTLHSHLSPPSFPLPHRSAAALSSPSANCGSRVRVWCR